MTRMSPKCVGILINFIFWRVSEAEKLPVEDNSVDLITVGMALHWFDHPKFYKEVCNLLYYHIHPVGYSPDVAWFLSTIPTASTWYSENSREPFFYCISQTLDYANRNTLYHTTFL